LNGAATTVVASVGMEEAIHVVGFQWVMVWQPA
jgi:hypothetical protein